MMKVTQAFDAFLRRLEPRAEEAASASRQKDEVIAKLQKGLHPKEGMLSGSFGRRTAVRPLHDIDLFVVLGADSGFAEQPPATCLKRVAAVLREAYPQVDPQPGFRSVHLGKVPGGVDFDVVPAVEVPGQSGVFKIPDRDVHQWIRTNPWKHQELCNAADATAQSKFRPILKMLKRWRDLHGVPIRSFLLEAISYKAFPQAPDRYPDGLAHLFQFVGERVPQPCPDPAGLGSRVDAGMDPNRRQQTSERLLGAARDAANALKAEREGDLTTAHRLWGKLLGADYHAE